MSPLSSSRRRLVAGLVVVACVLTAVGAALALGARPGARIEDPHAAHANALPGPTRAPAAGPRPTPGASARPEPSSGASALPEPSPSASPGDDVAQLDGRVLRAGATPLPPPSASPTPALGRAGEGTTLEGAASRPSGAAPLRADGTRERSLPAAPRVDPRDVLEGTLGPGGCLKEYGSAGQCLPAVPPSRAAHAREMLAAGRDASAMNHPYTCTEVRTMFATGLVVRVSGVDPQGLDRNGDGIACGRGDGDA